ncbi:MAG TPA: hypothetical protein VMT15_05580 [Bryobacteraceae bacterium]|nr:hypothetical protein [Bryobacteraceae bacterium]
MPEVIVPEMVAREDGASNEIALGSRAGRPLLLTLGITRILEQDSLDVSVWGSADRQQWRQIAAYPQKFYCGTYLLLVDLSREPNMRYLRVQWRMGRWGETDPKPVVGFFVSAEELMYQTAGAA